MRAAVCLLDEKYKGHFSGTHFTPLLPPYCHLTSGTEMECRNLWVLSLPPQQKHLGAIGIGLERSALQLYESLVVRQHHFFHSSGMNFGVRWRYSR